MYAHLQDRLVQEGQTLESNQVIATCGNSGRSEAPHLHLEIRFSKAQKFPGWAAIRNGLVSPIALFNR
jgi:murein DD-endopeptidase MepM/ murein hydrolase activator NlpD